MLISVDPYHYETFARWLDGKQIPIKYVNYINDHTTEEINFFIDLNDEVASYLLEYCPYPSITDKIKNP